MPAGAMGRVRGKGRVCKVLPEGYLEVLDFYACIHACLQMCRHVALCVCMCAGDGMHKYASGSVQASACGHMHMHI